MQSLSNIYPPLQCAYQATTSPSNRKEVLGGLFKTSLDVILLNGLTCGYASYRSWLGIVLDKPHCLRLFVNRAAQDRSALDPLVELGVIPGRVVCGGLAQRHLAVLLGFLASPPRPVVATRSSAEQIGAAFP